MKRFLLAHLLVVSCAFAQRVPWTLETATIPSALTGDPAFVFVPGAGLGTQLIVGTDTAQQGIYVFPIGGAAQSINVGGVKSADARGNVLVVSSTASNSLLFYRVSDAGVSALDTGTFTLPSPNQLALARTADGGLEVWVDTNSTEVRRYTVTVFSSGTVAFSAPTSVTVPEIPSGLSIDDRTGRLYVGQPSLGVLTVDRGGSPSFLLSIDAGQLGTVVGGMDLFQAADGGVLIFSAAPNEGEVKVHEHGGGQANFLTALQFGDTDGGVAILTRPGFLDVFETATPGFPQGVLVVQDGVIANYKLVSLAAVDAVFPLPPPATPGTFFPLDAGSDAGVGDAGVPDGGLSDGGTGGGAGGGSGGAGGGTGVPVRPAPGLDPEPACGCTGSPFALLPALLALWCIRRRRFTP